MIELEERCFHYFEARREKRKGVEARGYEDRGCFTCYGHNKECRAYTGIDVKMPFLKSCRPFAIYNRITNKKEVKNNE